MVYQFQLPSIIYFQEPVLVTIIMKVAMTEDALWIVLLFLLSNGERKIETDTYQRTVNHI